jgi:hypothetical protein
MSGSELPAARDAAPRPAPLDAAALAQDYVRAGVLWALLAGLLAVLTLLPLALGRALPLAPLGPGRLDPAYRWLALWGAVSLPLAGALLWLAGLGAAAGPARRLARSAFWLWQLALVLGLAGVLLGFQTPDPWFPGPLAARALLALAAAAWAAALWRCPDGHDSPLAFGRLFGLVAAVVLLGVQAISLLSAALGGAGQAMAQAWAGRAALDLWVLLAGAAVAAACLPAGLGRPLYGRRMLLFGLALWLPLAALAAGRDLGPDLYPAALDRLALAATAGRLAPAALLGIGLLGTWVGEGPAARAPGAVRFASLGLLVALGAVLADAGTAAVASATQFTAWQAPAVLAPPLASGLLLAAAAGYAVRWPDPAAPWPRRHLWLAVVATVAGLAPLWPIALAELGLGPVGLAPIEARLRLPGALLGLAAAVAWWLGLGPNRSGAADRAALTVPAGGLAVRPGAAVGLAVVAVVPALFLALFLPLADPSSVAPTARSDARDLAFNPLREAGRQRYVAEGCMSCHTQRVRPGERDAALGPPTRPGDYGAGPALGGLRRMGPDLAWIGDRAPGAEGIGTALAVHGPTGSFPLAGPGGSAPPELVDYLAALRSEGTGGP